MILNFTVHKATPDQIKDGLVDMSEYIQSEIKRITNLEEIPDYEILRGQTHILEIKAKELVALMFSAAEEIKQKFHEEERYCVIDGVMIGSGVPAFNYFLVKELKGEGIPPYFSHSKRECVETPQEDGTVTKTYVFKHEGFYTF